MDWAALTQILAERGEQPMIVTDRRGTVLLATRSLCTRLHVSARALLGKSVSEFVTADDDALRAFLEAERVSSLPSAAEAKLQDSLGRRHLGGLEIEAAPGNDGYVVRVTFRASARSLSGRDIDYDVEVGEDRLGSLRRVNFMGGALPNEELAHSCFQILCGQGRECRDCPAMALASQAVGTERRVIRRYSAGSEINSAVLVAPNLVRISRRHLPDLGLRDAHAAYLEGLMVRSKLSPREREVLHHLLHGATLTDISCALGIAERTVKFHQANLLAKLGADSRSDLLRVFT
jgi:DNA-binding CsgD family transcriptional regulator